MSRMGAYGRGLADHFRLSDAPTLISRSLRKTALAVTQLKRDAPDLGMTTPIPIEDAYLVALQVREVPDHALWLDDKQVAVDPISACTTMMYDLRRDPRAVVRSPFHSLHFYLPRSALNSSADEQGARPIDELNYRPGSALPDPVVTHLGLALLPAFENPDQASPLFIDYVTRALCAHVVHRYGNGPAKWNRGGLTPRQERLAKELLTANLDGGLCLSDLAGECGLSTSHFIRAFRKSTGLPPHRWLLHQRVTKAKGLLLSSSLSISEIALACGFVDQSHLNRVFVRLAGATPGAWRRTRSL